MTEIRNRREQWPLPATWEWKSLADVAKVNVGSAKAETSLATNDGTIPLVLSSDLKNSKKIDISRRIREADLTTNSIKLFTRNQLLVTAIGSTAGTVGILDFDALLSKTIFAITPNEKDVDLDFLFYYFRTKGAYSYIKSVLRGAIQQYISIPDVKLIQIPIPLLLEVQRQIVLRIEALIRSMQKSKQLLEKMYSDLQKTLELELIDIFTSPVTTWWTNKAPLVELLKIKSDLQDTLHPIYQQYPFIDVQSIEPITG